MISIKFRGSSYHFRFDHFYIVDFHSALTFPDRDLWSEGWVKIYIVYIVKMVKTKNWKRNENDWDLWLRPQCLNFVFQDHWKFEWFRKKDFDNFNDFEETITIDFFWHVYTGQQWVSMVFWVVLPLASMALFGQEPLVERWNGFNRLLRSNWIQNGLIYPVKNFWLCELNYSLIKYGNVTHDWVL